MMVKRFVRDNCGVGDVEFASSLDAEHVECVCKALENTANIDQLASFLDTFPPSTFAGASPTRHHVDERRSNGGRRRPSSALADNDANHASSAEQCVVTCRDALRRAKALVLFHQRRFDAFYAYVASTHFAADHHAFLQRLWNEAHYMETELQRGKKLDPVSRYRVRKKNAFPRTIWDGEGTSYCFKKSARTMLRQWYAKEQTPSQERKRELARLTNLSVVQVSNWFKNQRQRARQYQREGRSTNNSCCSGYSSAVDSEPEADEEEADAASAANERAVSSDDDGGAHTGDDAADSSRTVGTVGVDASSVPPHHYPVFSEPKDADVAVSSGGTKPSYIVACASGADYAPPTYYYGSHQCSADGGNPTPAMYAAAAAAAAAAATAQMCYGGAADFYQFRQSGGYAMPAAPPYYYCPPSVSANPPPMASRDYGYSTASSVPSLTRRLNGDTAEPTTFPPSPDALHSTTRFSAAFFNGNDNNSNSNNLLKYHCL